MSADQAQSELPRPGEQPEPEPILGVAEPVELLDELPILENVTDGVQVDGLLDRLGVEVEDTPERSRPDWQELQAQGNEAYAAARAREDTHGLDATTVDLYRRTTDSYLQATWWAPKETDLVGETPIIDVRMARAFARQAKATPHGKYVSPDIMDERAHLQWLALRAQQRAIRGVLDGRIAELPADELSAVEPMVVEAEVGAAEEAGTKKDFTGGIGKVDAQTPGRLEAQGEAAIEEFAHVHATASDQGLEYIAKLSDKLETGIHNLPLA